jgi:DNA-binding NarL/FixJ family response regulator
VYEVRADVGECEVEVLPHIAEGLSSRDIGAKLLASEQTIKVHVKHIMDKPTASDRTQAVAFAVCRGIIRF